MDDCSLEKLSIKPGKLSPIFKRDTTEYSVTLGSNVAQITIDCFASDSGASYTISGTDGDKIVPLKEGKVNDVKIEVTAEDGTVRVYWIHAKRISAKDATLTRLKMGAGKLEPTFSPDITEYICVISCDLDKVTASPTVPDAKIVIEVAGEKPGTPTLLNLGNTAIRVDVTSADGSNKQTYTVLVMRKQIPRFIEIIDKELAHKLECPVTLSPLYRPMTIKDTDPKHTFSAPVLDEFTKTSKIDPLSYAPLTGDWKFDDKEIENVLSDSLGRIPLANGTFSETVKLRKLGELLKNCKQTEFGVDTEAYNPDLPVKHKVEVRPWEVHLQQIYDESDITELVKMAEESVKKYLSSLLPPGCQSSYSLGAMPIIHLDHAAHCYATAIKMKSDDANLHVNLGMILEEKYLAQDMYDLKKQETKKDKSMNVQAKESSKEDECAAICKLQGVSDHAPLPLQLKAIEREFHSLMANSQSAKADHVQALFAWKSKQATQEGAASQKVSDDESPLGQAYLKYLDALSLNESKAIYHFHVGRMLVVMGDYHAAVQRLDAALGWNPQYQMARMYMGLAWSLQKGGPGDKTEKTIRYLMEGMELLLQRDCAEAMKSGNEKRTELLAEYLLRNTNVHVLRSLVQLGRMLKANPNTKDCMKSVHVFHTAALVACQVLPLLSRGDTYKQVEWVLLESHSDLLQLLLGDRKENAKLIVQRCRYLSALIHHCTIPTTARLLDMQKQTIQVLVEMEPCNSHALLLLGNTQLKLYENEANSANATQLLEEAKLSFLASISKEGKKAAGDPPEELVQQTWWRDKIKAEEAMKAAAAKVAPKPTLKKASMAKAVWTPRNSVAIVAPAGKAAPPVKRAPPATRGVGKQSISISTGKGTVKSAVAVPKAPPERKGSQYSCGGSKGQSEEEKQKEPVSAGSETETGEPAPINKKDYQARLGLARVLAKLPGCIDESRKYYNQVIDMAPEIHDAYIENANMLTQTDPMAAVDIYSKFPTSANPTFDDAYIFGEIVLLLMKCEKFDDPRLESNLIGMGRVMGLGVIEKYVNILDGKGKSKILKRVYAGINHKDVDDPELQAFFKFRCWI